MQRQFPLVLDITLSFRIVLLVAAIRTTSFNVRKSYVLPPLCTCFVWISEPTAIISLYSINWLAIITETECVYCSVRIGSLIQAGKALLRVLSVFLCQCLSTNSPHSPSTGCSYQKDKWAKPGKLPKSEAHSEIGEHWVGKNLRFVGAFSELRKATISLMSVCPRGTTRLPLDGFEIWYLSIFWKSG